MAPQYIKIDENGNKFYYKDCKMMVLHREDGPAIEYANGTNAWFVDAKFHRLDGPAIEFASGRKAWYINHIWLTEEEFKRRTSPEIVLTLDEIASKLGIDVSKLKIKK